MRDRMQEHFQTASNRASTLVQLRRQRESDGWNELILVAQALLVCGLPYHRTKERQITRRARLAGDEVTVTYTCCDPEVEMPFGSDRTLLHWVVDRAIRADHPFVAWDTAIEFLKDAGLTDGGANFRDLRARFDRLASVAITIVRKRAGEKDRLILPIVEESNLPSSVDLRAEQRGLRRVLGDQFGFRLNERFWRETREHHVPVPWELIRKTRKQSQLQDDILFLYWRSFAAKSASVVPWSGIEEQSPSSDSNPRRIKTRFKQALQAIRVIDPCFPGEVLDEGLQVISYQGFLPSGETRKRLT